jgi:hypothetical protein
MTRDTQLELFRIARDIAVAQHKHLMERSAERRVFDRVAERKALEAGGEPAPTVQECFVEAYRFMTSELAAAADPDEASEPGE